MTMDVELIEIRDFIAATHPFDVLPAEEQERLARDVEIRYARKGTELITPGKPAEFLFIVRTGALETHDPDGELLARLSEGECCGVRALLRGEAVNRSAAIEDSLLYQLPAKRFDELRKAYKQIDFFFAPMAGGRLATAMGAVEDKNSLNLLSIHVEEMLARAPVTIGPDATVQQAAQCMRENRVSCVLVTEGEALVGIFTDRDLRNRVVAEGVAFDAPLFRVMTPDPIRLEASAYAFDAMLTMSRHNIRHLPVVRGGRIAGCITTTNLIRIQTNSPVYLVGDIHKRSDADGLREVLSHIPDLVHQMAESGATAHNIGHIVSTLTDAATVRLIQIAEATLGPPPVPYAWAAAGSQGRHEQTAQSDQDNCLILDNAYDEALHGEYFSRLSKMVCDGLNTCGYVYCPGEMMAMTGQWRQPLATWKRYFSKWIEEPEPKALMLSSIFFDLRFIHGEEGLFDALQDLVMEKCAKNKIFLAYMAGNALTHQPPVGFFRNFVLIRGGDHNHTLDMKHTGVVPIIDLARVYALSAGVKTVNTHERLMQAMERKAISQDGAMDLRDALEFISLTRLRHQARKIRAGEKADNYLEPEALSSFERSHLKDAFGVVKTMQAAMANTYQAGRF
jgi:CBS domain-containing protein